MQTQSSEKIQKIVQSSKLSALQNKQIQKQLELIIQAEEKEYQDDKYLQIVQCSHLIGEIYFFMGKYKVALLIFEEITQLIEQWEQLKKQNKKSQLNLYSQNQKVKELVFLTSYHTAQTLLQLCKYQEAEKVLSILLKSFEKHYDITAEQSDFDQIENDIRIKYSHLLAQYGKILIILSQFKQGLSFIDKCVQLRTSKANNRASLLEISDSLQQLGFYQLYTRNFTQALSYFLEALSAKQQVKDQKYVNYYWEVQNHQKYPNFEMKLDKDISEVLYLLAQTYFELNLFQKSEEHYKQSLQKRRNIFKVQTHPLIADCLTGIGKTLVQQEKFEEGNEYIQEGFNLRKIIYPNSEHLDISDSYSVQALSESLQNKHQKSIDNYEISLSLIQSIIGEKTIFAQICLQEIGQQYQKAKQYEDAISKYCKAYKMSKELHGQSSALTIFPLKQLAESLHLNDKLEDSLLFYYQCLEIEKELEIEESEKNTLNSLAQIYRKQNEFELAISCYYKSYIINQKLNGIVNVQNAALLSNIGFLYLKQDQQEEALEFQQKSSQILKKLYYDGLLSQKEEVLVANSLDDIANTFIEKRNYSNALKYQKEALQIKQQLISVPIQEMLLSLNNLRVIYQHLNQIENYLECKQQILKQVENKYGSYNEKVLEMKKEYQQEKEKLNIIQSLPTFEVKAESQLNYKSKIKIIKLNKLKNNESEQHEDEDDEENEKNNCSICLQQFEKFQTKTILPCHHQFHQCCVESWLLNNKMTCPYCRADVIKLIQKGQEYQFQSNRFY